MNWVSFQEGQIVSFSILFVPCLSLVSWAVNTFFCVCAFSSSITGIVFSPPPLSIISSQAYIITTWSALWSFEVLKECDNYFRRKKIKAVNAERNTKHPGTKAQLLIQCSSALIHIYFIPHFLDLLWTFLLSCKCSCCRLDVLFWDCSKLVFMCRTRQSWV